ncbi:MAG TPA: tetratricopeptide repeat protein [Saprospiraceae bacterium]|nr:tetratricopeptide repeat protein [Saprospiraceae bacterium]
MQFHSWILLSSLLIAVLSACTPKTTQPTQSSEPTPTVKPAVSANPCATFSDSKAGEAALDAHVIYRDFLRREDYQQAIPYWRQAFTAAPAADGQRTTHFDDGVKIYGYLLSQQASIEGKKLYLDSIFLLYDRMHACYPENSFVDGKKAFELYYNYRELTDNQTIFEHFTKVLDAEVLDAPAFVINPFTALLVEMYTSKEVNQTIAVKYAKQVLAITEKHAQLIETAPCDMHLKYEESANGDCISMSDSGEKMAASATCCAWAKDIREGWPIVIGYAPAQLDVFETVKGFFDCDYYKHKYIASVNLDSVACDDLPLILSQLKWGDCDESDPAFAALNAEYQERCIISETAGPLTRGRDALNEGRYQDAVNHYKEYVASTEDPEKKARYNLRIAKIYYGHLKNFSRAREFARLALRDEPNLGEAYILIGKLYASSGPLCGPGRGWDSQVVTWPAIDMFARAKQVDPSVTAEANRLIGTYSRYMPTVEDIFQRQLVEGQSFFVGCWIQESTTIRAARE